MEMKFYYPPAKAGGKSKAGGNSKSMRQIKKHEANQKAGSNSKSRREFKKQNLYFNIEGIHELDWWIGLVNWIGELDWALAHSKKK